jgi:hypothetical protein
MTLAIHESLECLIQQEIVQKENMRIHVLICTPTVFRKYNYKYWMDCRAKSRNRNNFCMWVCE